MTPASSNQPLAAPAEPVLLNVKQTATLLNASPRTIYRLADAGRMPRPVRVGSLVRWRADELHHWIDKGCPNCRPGSRRGEP